LEIVAGWLLEVDRGVFFIVIGGKFKEAAFLQDGHDLLGVLLDDYRGRLGYGYFGFQVVRAGAGDMVGTMGMAMMAMFGLLFKHG
jgi:hypothetical protein